MDSGLRKYFRLQKHLRGCRHWRELEDEHQCVEYCRIGGRPIACSGAWDRCLYPECYQEQGDDNHRFQLFMMNFKRMLKRLTKGGT